MSLARGTAAAAALCVAAAAGCGIGPGDETGEVEVTVTRDYGYDVLLTESEPIRESDTVLRVLDRNADLETSYGGGFVQSIDGLSGEAGGGRRSDWFFYVNGIESPIGAGQYHPGAGDRIWWDYRDWTAAMRVPAVVGSWPEPFVNGFQGTRYGTEIVCLASKDDCHEVDRRLEDAGVSADEAREQSVRVLVGPWDRVRSDQAARLLGSGPSRSGVFANFTGSGPGLLNLLDETGQVTGTIGHGGGLVAALRPTDGPPTWVVTGTDAAGVTTATSLLGEGLRDQYAVAVGSGGDAIGVPHP